MLDVPLLPAPSQQTWRDPARAVRRLAGQPLELAKEEMLDALLGLPEFHVTGYRFEELDGVSVVHLYCEHQHTVAFCPRCRTPSVDGHESKSRCIRDLDLLGRHTFVHFISRRFDCVRCGRPFTEELFSVERRRRQTRRFEQRIYEQCLNANRKAVAAQEWLDQSTVTAIWRRWAEKKAKRQARPLVRVLGIDEIAIRKGHGKFALILSDLERHCIIAVLDDRRKETLEQWFDSLSDEERRAIRVVSMDMWEPYYQAVKAKLPHAEIVIDRFHVMGQLNGRLTQMRRAIQARADETTRAVLKGSRWILVKNREELDEEETAKLTQVLAACPELRILYCLKEEFRRIFEKIRDRGRAARFLRAWVYKAEQTRDKFMLKFVITLQTWWDQILNYFVGRITNGFVEGINRAIRSIINRAYGYRNFTHLRLQILAECGPP